MSMWDPEQYGNDRFWALIVRLGLFLCVLSAAVVIVCFFIGITLLIEGIL